MGPRGWPLPPHDAGLRDEREEDTLARGGAELRPHGAIPGALHGRGEVPDAGGAGVAEVPPLGPPALQRQHHWLWRDHAELGLQLLVSRVEATPSVHPALWVAPHKTMHF